MTQTGWDYDIARRALWVAGPDTFAPRIAGIVISGTGFDEALARLSDCPASDLIVVETGERLNNTQRHVIQEIDRRARTDFTPVIFSFTSAILDEMVALVTAPGAHLLCDPDPVDFAAALAMTAPARFDAVREGNGLHDARIRRLAEEVARIASALTDLARPETGAGRADVFADGMVGFRGEHGASTLSASQVRAEIRARSLRSRFLPADLFADPAWDILLDLTLAQIERRRVSVSSLCIAAHVPATTGLRFIQQMTARGMLVRVDDPNDRRRVFIELSPDTRAAMHAYFGAVAQNAAA